MHLLTYSFLFPLLASAVRITYPSTGDTVNINSEFTITWVYTAGVDPNQIALYLTGPAAAGSIGGAETITGQVDTSAGKYTVPAGALQIITTASASDLSSFSITINTPGNQGNTYVGSSSDFTMVANGTASSSSSVSSSSMTTTMMSSATSASAANTASATSSGLAVPMVVNGGNAVVAAIGALAAAFL